MSNNLSKSIINIQKKSGHTWHAIGGPLLYVKNWKGIENVLGNFIYISKAACFDLFRPLSLNLYNRFFVCLTDSNSN